jgi:hypothetical protein
MNLQKTYDIYLLFIIVIKLFFLVFIIGSFYYTYISHSPNALQKSATFKFWKNRTEFIFSLSMSFLLLYLFYPWRTSNLVIDKETKILIYIYAIILILNSDYREFIQNIPWINKPINS